MGYEFLLTGLPELQVDGDAPITTEALLDLFDELLDEKDAEVLGVLRMRNDDEVILNIKTQYEDSFIGRPDWWEEAVEVLSDEDLRTQVLYEYGKQCKCRFVRDWFAYNQDLNNVMVATICRKHGFDVGKGIIGHNEVAQILRKNLPQKDFGLAAVMDNLPEIMAVVDIENLREREKRLDAIRFLWLEEKTRFSSFSLENVLAYWLQAEMLNRWSLLTLEKGEQIFRELVADMRKGIKID
ncbi:MAG: DUF2764 family protein [Paludibacteraceae bacterium]|nr:DUF2764 family protein [Paludibacteraceae bacterium]MBR6015263.1 DUF2764 family protein [Bacillota bacterium]